MAMLEAAISPIDCRGVPVDRLEAEIIGWSGNLVAGMARLLGVVAEFDRREAWKGWGCRSAAHWLSWKCGDSLHTAREKVRVARRLEELPLVAAAFGQGRLSYSKVRAVPRVATGVDDDHWLEVALDSPGSQLDRIVAEVRSALERDENRDARTAFERRRVTRCRRCDGLAEMSMVAPGDVVATVWAVIDTDALEALAEPDPAPGADLDPGTELDGGGECTLAGVRVAPVVVSRWACDIRASSWLHAHHIVHWAGGGPTDLHNLVSLCGFHHHLVHEGGWALTLVDDTVVWTDPAGMPAAVEPLDGDASAIATQNVPEGTLQPRSPHDRLDFAFVVAVITDTCRARRSRRGE